MNSFWHTAIASVRLWLICRHVRAEKTSSASQALAPAILNLQSNEARVSIVVVLCLKQVWKPAAILRFDIPVWACCDCLRLTVTELVA